MKSTLTPDAERLVQNGLELGGLLVEQWHQREAITSHAPVDPLVCVVRVQDRQVLAAQSWNVLLVRFV